MLSITIIYNYSFFSIHASVWFYNISSDVLQYKSCERVIKMSFCDWIDCRFPLWTSQDQDLINKLPDIFSNNTYFLTTHFSSKWSTIRFYFLIKYFKFPVLIQGGDFFKYALRKCAKIFLSNFWFIFVDYCLHNWSSHIKM